MNGKTRETVIVSGSSSGIGLAICKLLIEQGYHIEGIDKKANEALAGEAAYRHHSLDLERTESLADKIVALDKLIESPIRALVNNAGIGIMGNLEQLSVADMDLLMRNNFLCHAIVSKIFLPRLKRQQRADIIFMGSEAALNGARQGSIYCASKFAIRGFAQALREECGKSGVRVSLINPGAVRTAFFDQLHFEPGAEPGNAIAPEDVAQVLLGILRTRPGTVIDEINLSPQNQVWQRKPVN